MATTYTFKLSLRVKLKLPEKPGKKQKPTVTVEEAIATLEDSDSSSEGTDTPSKATESSSKKGKTSSAAVENKAGNPSTRSSRTSRRLSRRVRDDIDADDEPKNSGNEDDPDFEPSDFDLPDSPFAESPEVQYLKQEESDSDGEKENGDSPKQNNKKDVAVDVNFDVILPVPKAPRTKSKSDSKRFQCQFCGKQFALSSVRNTHEKRHREKQHKCDQCDKAFHQKGDLQRHLKHCHEGERPWQCDICGDRFKRRDTLVTHGRVHADPGLQKLFKCSTCGKLYSSQGALQMHNKIHTGEKPHQCATCGARFIYSNTLAAHEKTHTGERPFKCSVCDHTFITRSNLYQHERRKHKIDVPANALIGRRKKSLGSNTSETGS